MNVQSVITQLATDYDLLGDPVDLSCVGDEHGESLIFNTLLSLHRPIFRNNQRIVVIQPEHDLYSYPDNIASDSLIFLQTCLQKIDISNYFVIVISSNTEIDTELAWVQQHHSTDISVIKSCLIGAEFKKIIPDKDTFCVNLWKHLHVSSQLDVLPCCVAKNNAPLGNLADKTVEQIINGELANSMRLKMLSNQRCTECAPCYLQEETIGQSRRIKDNIKFDATIHSLTELTNHDGSLKSFLPRSIDIRLNNICNLKCRTCSGISSSKLAIEEKQLFNNSINFEKTPSVKLRNKVFDSVIDYFSSVEQLYFAGGEPLLMEEHYRILDHLIDTKKTNVPIVYNTNLTLLEFKNKNILDYWKKFSNVELGASLDGHGRVLEYVRHGAKWPEIENNLSNIKKHCPHVKFTVTSTISLLSVESVMELQRMWHETNTLHIDNFRMWLMQGNDYLSLQSLLPDHKQLIADKIANHCAWLKLVGADHLATQWENFQQYMLLNDKSYVNMEFAKVNRARDIARKEKFETLYPQFADLYSAYY